MVPQHREAGRLLEIYGVLYSGLVAQSHPIVRECQPLDRVLARVATLESWLTDATWYLCDDAVAQIRAEITDHYETALTAGQTP